MKQIGRFCLRFQFFRAQRNKNCMRIFFACLASYLLFASHHGFAVEDGLFELSLEELLEVNVSTTTLTEKTKKDAPASITVYTREQINDLGVHFLHELMNYVPGFQSFRQGEASDEYYHSIRGHRVGTSSREVLVLVDGQRFNRESGHAQAAPSLSLAQFKQVEFIRGPGSALYGSNAYTGVINLISRDKESEFRATVTDIPAAEASALWHGYIGDWSWDFYGRAKYDEGQDYRVQDNFSLTNEDAYDQQKHRDLSIKFSRDNIDISLLHYHRHTEGFPVLEYNNPDFNETSNLHTSINYQQALIWSSAFSTDISLRAVKNRYQPKVEFLPEGFATATGASNLEALFAKASQAEMNREIKVHANYQFSADHSLQFGAEHRHSDVEDLTVHYNYNLSEIPFVYLDGDFSYSEVINEQTNSEVSSAYLQTQNQLGSHVEIIAGFRGDHYANLDDSFSPRLALTWQPNEHHTFKALYGEAFRAPTVNERTVGQNQFIEGNPNLKPETIKTGELIWLYSQKRFIADLTLFYSHIENLIDQTVIDGIRSFQNSPEEQQFQGIETELKYRINNTWQVAANAAHNFKTASADFRQADTLGSVQVNYQRGALRLGLSAYYNAEREMQIGDELKALDDYWLTRGYARWVADFGEVELSLSNALDEDYKTPTQGAALNQGFPNRGRELSLTFIRAF